MSRGTGGAASVCLIMVGARLPASDRRPPRALLRALKNEPAGRRADDHTSRRDASFGLIAHRPVGIVEVQHELYPPRGEPSLWPRRWLGLGPPQPIDQLADRTRRRDRAEHPYDPPADGPLARKRGRKTMSSVCRWDTPALVGVVTQALASSHADTGDYAIGKGDGLWSGTAY